MTNQDREVISLFVALANYQDNLLQSYRRIFIAVESIFIALVVAIITFQPIDGKVLVYTTMLTSIGLIIVYLWHYIVKDRAKWVDWWHKKILEAEKGLAKDQQVFTEFKHAQKGSDTGSLLYHGRKSIRYVFNIIIPMIFAGTWFFILILVFYLYFSAIN